MDKISIYFAFDPCPDTRESRKTFEDRDKWLSKDYERFEIELRGSPDFPNDQLETLQLRQTTLGVLAAPMYVDGGKIGSTEFLHAGLEKTALKRLERLETVVLKLEHEAQGHDKSDFQAFKLSRLLEKVKGFLSYYAKAIERRDFELWEWSNHYISGGQLHFRTVSPFDQSTQFETVFEDGKFHCQRVNPTPTEIPASLPEPERKATAQAPAKLTARQVALFIYYRWEAGERDFFMDGKEKGLGKFAVQYQISPNTLQQKFNEFSNHPKEGRAKREAGTLDNKNDHETIIEMLEAYPVAHRLANDNLKSIEQKA